MIKIVSQIIGTAATKGRRANWSGGSSNRSAIPGGITSLSFSVVFPCAVLVLRGRQKGFGLNALDHRPTDQPVQSEVFALGLLLSSLLLDTSYCHQSQASGLPFLRNASAGGLVSLGGDPGVGVFSAISTTAFCPVAPRYAMWSFLGVQARHTPPRCIYLYESGGAR